MVEKAKATATEMAVALIVGTGGVRSQKPLYLLAFLLCMEAVT